MYRLSARIIIGIVAVLGIQAQWYGLDNGKDDYYKILAPELQASSASPVAIAYPFSHLSNPALNANMQRFHLGVNYSGMLSDGGYRGHVASLGIGIPTKIGNFTNSVHFVNADFETLSYGLVGTIHTSFAKAITDRFHFGFGLSGGYMQLENASDWKLALNLGATYTFEFVRIPYLRLGGTLRNLGKWMQPAPNAGPFPAPFSLAFGAELGIVEIDQFSLALRSNLEFPSFQNLRWDIGFTSNIFQVVELATSWQLDLLGLLENEKSPNSFIPSIGIAVHIPLQKLQFPRAPQKNIEKGAELIVSPSVFPTVDDIWIAGIGGTIAFGAIDEEGPVISYAVRDAARHISPNNDGVQDILSLGFTIEDESILDSYTWEFKDKDGTIVKTIQNNRERQDSSELSGFFKRLFEADKGIIVPESIDWDGRTDSGAIASDGVYTVQVLARDKNKNTTLLEVGEVYIDSTYPELTLELQSPRLFSPNGDGNLDLVAFNQAGSLEPHWSGSILDGAGIERNSFEWNQDMPANFEWDGRAADGSLVEDGIYSYTLLGRDAAGNEKTQTLENIIVRTEETPLDLRISNSAFSPNNDGVQDALTITPIIGNTNGIREWYFTVFDSITTEQVYQSTGTRIPQQIIFDGRSNAGTMLIDGNYFASLQLFYEFGNQPEVFSPPFLLDTISPSINAASDTAVISPNNDGVQDVFAVRLAASAEQSWFIEIRDENNIPIWAEEWANQLPEQLLWDARDENGRIVPDGRYRLHIFTSDRAGNSIENSAIAFNVDTTESDLIISPEFLAFSPNADGVQDSNRIFTELTNFKNESVSYEFEILRENKTSVYSTSGDSRLPPSFSWDGKDQRKQIERDGDYTAVLRVRLPNGNRAEAVSVPFSIDTFAPTLEASVASPVFSPDEDGLKDELVLFLQSSPEREWSFSVQDARTRNLVYSERISDAALNNKTWNGKDDEGNKIPDGRYTIRIASVDRAGNTTEKIIDNIRIRTTSPDAYIVLESNQASPNNDGVEDNIPISVTLTSGEGLQEWELQIRNENALVVKTVRGEAYQGTLSYLWDGLSDAGTLLEGNFNAQFSAVYDHGPNPSAVSRPFRVDTSAPTVTVDAQPLPFSPDNDGVNDTLYVDLDVYDVSPIESWKFDILDRNEDVFQSLSGTGFPSEQLQWDGRGLDGSIVVSAEDYPYIFSIVDSLGNRSRVEGMIPVDVLVIRDGNTLRIQISAINFEPFSSVLILDNSVQGRKNSAILERLVTIFKKYSAYRIKIEGHAVNLTGSEREEIEELLPLSTARALSVMNELNNRGINVYRIETEGLGGRRPLVPHTDKQNRWKNRRVEFVLLER